MAKTIIFDLMGVVFVEGRIIKNILAPMLPGKDYLFIKGRYVKYRVGEISREEFWAGLSDTPDKTEREYLDKFKLDKDFSNVIDYLRSKGYRLAILSDIPVDWANYLIQKFKFRDIFGTIVISGHHGYKKPDPKIYRILLDELKADPKDCAFIDDKLKNLIPATELGIKAIWYRKEELDTVPFTPARIIRSLLELKEIF